MLDENDVYCVLESSATKVRYLHIGILPGSSLGDHETKKEVTLNSILRSAGCGRFSNTVLGGV